MNLKQDSWMHGSIQSQIEKKVEGSGLGCLLTATTVQNCQPEKTVNDIVEYQTVMDKKKELLWRAYLVMFFFVVATLSNLVQDI
jgi:hypothetical protein